MKLIKIGDSLINLDQIASIKQKMYQVDITLSSGQVIGANSRDFIADAQTKFGVKLDLIAEFDSPKDWTPEELTY